MLETIENASSVPSEYVSEVVWFQAIEHSGNFDELGLRNTGDTYISFLYSTSGIARDDGEDWEVKVIGHSTIKAEDATEAQLKALYDEYDIKTGKKKEYEPCVGNVVAFEYKGYTCRGLIYRSETGRVRLISDWENQHYSVSDYDYSLITNLQKSGHTDKMPDSYLEYDEAAEIAQAYFSTPVFTGSYSERQTAWIKHHGLKVGSKVKVTRGFKSGEDGFWWNTSEAKDFLVGKELEINGIGTEEILIAGQYVPYFVLEPVVD